MPRRNRNGGPREPDPRALGMFVVGRRGRVHWRKLPARREPPAAPPDGALRPAGAARDGRRPTADSRSPDNFRNGAPPDHDPGHATLDHPSVPAVQRADVRRSPDG